MISFLLAFVISHLVCRNLLIPQDVRPSPILRRETISLIKVAYPTLLPGSKQIKSTVWMCRHVCRLLSPAPRSLEWSERRSPAASFRLSAPQKKTLHCLFKGGRGSRTAGTWERHCCGADGFSKTHKMRESYQKEQLDGL